MGGEVEVERSEEEPLRFVLSLAFCASFPPFFSRRLPPRPEHESIN